MDIPGHLFLAAVLDSLEDVVFVTDTDGVITLVNRAGAEQLALDKRIGAPPGDRQAPYPLYGRDGRPLGPDADPVTRVLATGQAVTGVQVGVSVGAEPRWFVMKTVPLRSGGRVLGTLSVLRPTAPVGTQESQLIDHSARLEAVVNLVSDAVFVVDAGGRLIYINAVGQRLLGFPLGASLEERARRLGVTDEDGQPVTPDAFPSSRGLAGETLVDQPYVITDPRGWPRRVVAAAHPLRRPDGPIYAALVTMRDITDQLRIRDELESAREAAEEASRLKDEFIAALSHELRAPLQPILGWTEILRRHGSLDAITAQALEVIGRNIRHQVRLVDDLLDLSRIVHGKLSLRRETFDLREQIRAAAEPFAEAALQKRVYFSLNLPGERIPMWGDAARVHQIAVNLISNAVKFTPAGGQVAVQLVAGPSSALLEVEDTGEGIAPEDLAIIFEPFRQGLGSSRRGGLGLGLNLVKRLTELHGGSVEAFSDGRGYGARFLVRLPFTSPAAETPAAPAETAARLSQRTILIVEDNADTREVLQYMLEVEGAHVEIAASGQEGVQLASRVLPQIVLCDIGLPDIDGLEVARQIRHNTGLARPRLIALTGYGQAEDIEHARQAGFEAHLTKPINLDQLLDLLTGSATGGPDRLTDGNADM
jgi:signal transduction histidine kinase/CheY-like chemotaxis protein